MSPASLVTYSPPRDHFALLRGPWTIRTIWHPREPGREPVPKAYHLCYRGVRQSAVPALPGHAFITPALGRMIRECVHLNAVNASHRPRVQCAADAPNPSAYLDSIKYLTPVIHKPTASTP